jgi:hypothetical protein
MKYEYLRFLKDKQFSFGDAEGLSENEINEIEQKMGIKFPLSYREFLMILGKKTGSFLPSYLMSSAYFERTRDSAFIASYDEIENIRVEINSSFFFFAQWQGYNFFFIDCNEKNPDPKVYLLTDTPEIIDYKESFSKFLIDEGLNTV